MNGEGYPQVDDTARPDCFHKKACDSQMQLFFKKNTSILNKNYLCSFTAEMSGKTFLKDIFFNFSVK